MNTGLSDRSQALLMFVSLALISLGTAAAAIPTNLSPETRAAVAGALWFLGALGAAFKEGLGGKAPATTTPTTSTPPPTPTLPEGQIGTFQGWDIYIENGQLNVYPPTSQRARFGFMIGVGSVLGYSPQADFVKIASDFITQLPKPGTAVPGNVPINPT